MSGYGYVYAFLTSTLGTGDRSPSRLGCLTAGAGVTQWLGGQFIQVKSLSLQEIQPRFVNDTSTLLN
jgi:hypothetical protein